MGKTCSMAKLALDWQPGQYILVVHKRVDQSFSYCFVLLFKYVRDTETGNLSIYILSDLLHYRPQTKLREGNVFTPVCQSFCSQGGCLPQCMLGYTPRH